MASTYADLQEQIAITAEQPSLATAIAAQLPDGLTFSFPNVGTYQGRIVVDATRDGLHTERWFNVRDETDRAIALSVLDATETARRISLAERIDAVLDSGYVLTLSGFGEINQEARLTAPTGEYVFVISLADLAEELGA